MLAPLTRPALDLLGADASLLIAEVEDYLRSVAHPAALAAGTSLDLSGLLATVSTPCRYGQVVQPWHAGIDLPEPTLLDRVRGRRPAAEVTVRQHLDLTSKYIHAHGWTQGALWNDAGAVCILGAQLRVLAAGYGTAATITEARLQIGNQLGRQREGQPLDQWNDAAGRHAVDVHTLLQRAAARA